MKIWFGFIIFPLIIFFILFSFFNIFALSIALGCGFRSDAQECAKIFYVLFTLIILSSIGFGYITTKLAPQKNKFFKANLYHLLFAIPITIFFHYAKVSVPYTIGFSLIFISCTAFGSFLFYKKYK